MTTVFRSAAIAASLALASGGVLAQEILGTFKGTEKVTVSRCGNYNGTTTGPWEVTNVAGEGASFSIKGSTAKGTIDGTGQFEGNSSTTSVIGIDRPGTRWSAKGKNTLDGDKMVGSAQGDVTGTNCVFLVEIEATRVR